MLECLSEVQTPPDSALHQPRWCRQSLCRCRNQTLCGRWPAAAVGWLAGVVWLADRRRPGVMSVAIALSARAKKGAGLMHIPGSYRLHRFQPNLHKHRSSQSQPNPDELHLHPNPSKRNCAAKPTAPHPALTFDILYSRHHLASSPPPGRQRAAARGRNPPNSGWLDHPEGNWITSMSDDHEEQTSSSSSNDLNILNERQNL